MYIKIGSVKFVTVFLLKKYIVFFKIKKKILLIFLTEQLVHSAGPNVFDQYDREQFYQSITIYLDLFFKPICCDQKVLDSKCKEAVPRV